MNLTEATMLAIQGKLKLDESKEVKKESIDVSVDDNGATIVETPEATVIVTDTQNVTEAPTEEVVVAEVPDEVETVEIPVEGDETIIPEEIVEPEATDEPTIDEIVDGETEADEEDLEESKKLKTESKDGYPEDFTISSIPGKFIYDPEVTKSFNAEAGYVNMEDDKYAFICDVANAHSINTNTPVIESKKPCKDCGKEVCECDKITEEVEVDSDGSVTLETVRDIDEVNGAIAAVIDEAIAELNDEDIDESKKAKLLDKLKTMKSETNKLQVILDGYLNILDESKKVEENVEIEVSEDGTEVEVKTDEGENVEVVDETEEPETSDEAEETASEEVVEVPEEETDEEVEDDSEFIEESFEKALTEYYKNNTKSIKGYKIEKISKDRNSIKIEGLLINKLNKSVKTELKANKVQEGKFYTRYEIANIKGLLESKTSTKGTMITKTTKESKLECTSITNKKLVK